MKIEINKNHIIKKEIKNQIQRSKNKYIQKTNKQQTFSLRS